MLSLREAKNAEFLEESVGRVVPNLSIDPPPCTIQVDGSVLSKSYFPELYDAIPPSFRVDAQAFTIVNALGRFFKAGTVPGKLVDDILQDHTHGDYSSGSGSHPAHGVAPFVAQYSGSWFRFGDEDTSLSHGVMYGVDATSNEGGGHNHSISIYDVVQQTQNNASGLCLVGPYTAPKHTPVPHYVHVGRDSTKCVVYVPGGGWIYVPDYNESVANWHQVANEFAKRNIHCYRHWYPVATAGNPSFPAALESLVEYLKELSELFSEIYVVGTSAGANVAALALQHGGARYVKKFVGLYGVYDLNAMPASFNTTYTDVYLGTTDPTKRAEASPTVPTIPFRLWHSTADTLVPHTQSLNWGGVDNTVVMTGQGHGFNPKDAGVLPAILDWLEAV